MQVFRSSFQAATHRVKGLSLAVVAVASLAACDTWMGGDGDPPLPGERISVLQHENRLVPTPGGSQVQIRLPAPEPNDAWPQAGGYSHHAMHHMEMVEVPALAWRSNAGSGSDKRDTLLGEPVVAAGRVFTVDTRAEVSAFDASSGRRLWRSDIAPRSARDAALLGGGLAYDNGRLFITTGGAQVVALAAESGQELWRTRVTAPVRSAPTVNGGRVFLVTIDNKGMALAATDGRILWTHAGVEEASTLLGGAAPAVDQGVVVMPYTSGEVAALRVDTGVPLWTDSVVAVRRTDATANLVDIRARPVIDGHRVFIAGHSGLLAGIDLRTGDRVWEVELASASQPWVAGDFLFAVTTDNQVAAIHANTGRILWVQELELWQNPGNFSGRITWAGPTLASDRLILTGSHGEAVSISPYTGRILGRMRLPSGISLPPAVAGGTLYFLTDSADLVAYR